MRCDVWVWGVGSLSLMDGGHVLIEVRVTE